MKNTVCLYSFVSLEYPNSGDKDAFYPPGRRKIPSHGRFSSHFQCEMGGMGELLSDEAFFKYRFFPSAVSQVTNSK